MRIFQLRSLVIAYRQLQVFSHQGHARRVQSFHALLSVQRPFHAQMSELAPVIVLLVAIYREFIFNSRAAMENSRDTP